jgi:DNA gyrase subunit A
MKTAYIDYSMSVIVSRALPDVRDGLKPVHRRVLYGMYELGMEYNKAHKKSARIVGEVLGKYHPHGDSSVYEAMVRMAQEWSLRYPLVDGQGNFGSMDGDSPAAMRYTEARMRRITNEILADLEKETVDFRLNFDDTLEEPTVMPTKLPNLLINGASGIAVGMATNMMPHNLTEVIDGVVATIENPEITIAELMVHIKAPDFPTGGIIYGMNGIREGFETGRGRVVLRAKTTIETVGNREVIIVNEIPYQVNKAHLVAKIADLVNDKKIDGISDIRDESDRNGLRVVIELRRDAVGSVVLNNLFKLTPLQTSYGINNVALVNGRPRTLNLKDIIEEFIKFRLEVIIRRTRFDLRKAEERAHILEGLLIALDHLDEVIALIRASKNGDEAKEGLMERFGLSEIQAKAILEMRLQRLTGLERQKIKDEYDEIQNLIQRLKAILESDEVRRNIIKEELAEIKQRFGDARRTEINYADGEISMDDLLADEEMIVTISHLGYIKRTKKSEYKAQGRGGRGSKGTKTRNEDFVEQIFSASTLDYLLFFTKSGKCYWLRVYDIPEASKASSGRVIQNILAMSMEDKVQAYIIIKDFKNKEFIDSHNIIFCTRQGQIKKTALEEYSRPRNGGILAMGIHEGDELLEAKLTTGNNEIIIATREGKAIRFNESKVRPTGRTASGVRAVDLGEDDNNGNGVIGMVCVDPNDPTTSILVISEKGTGKRSMLDEYNVTNRGGKGVKTISITPKTGSLIAIKVARDEDDLMIINKSGILIRTQMDTVRVMGRATQGVRVIRLDEDDAIADVVVIAREEEEDEIIATDSTITEGNETTESTETAEGTTTTEE